MAVKLIRVKKKKKIIKVGKKEREENQAYLEEQYHNHHTGKQRSQGTLVAGFHTWGNELTERWTGQPLLKHQNPRPRTRTPT